MIVLQMVRVINRLGLDLLRLGLEAVERSIAAEHKGDTNMNGKPHEDEEPKAPDFDSEKVEQLLAILDDVRDTAAYTNIRQAASMKLAEIDLELWEELYPEEAEAKKKKEEEVKKAEEERLQRLKEEQEKEKADAA